LDVISQRLHRLAVAIFFALMLIGNETPLGAAAVSEEFSAHDVINRALNALGGRRKLNRISALEATGRITLLAGFAGSYEMQAQRPDRLRTAWNITYISQVRAFDGENGWEKNASIRELAGDALDRIRDESTWLPLLSLDEAHVPVSMTEIAPASGPGPAAMTSTALSRHYRLDFRTDHGVISISIDAHSFLPIEMTRSEPYEEGPVVIAERYSDYRPVRGVMLPFHIERVVPDLPSAVTIDHYTLNPRLSRQEFENPNAGKMREPYELSISSIPRRVFKVPRNQFDDNWRRYWGIPFAPMERWILDFVIDERFGRYMAPASATLTYFAKDSVVTAETLTGTALQALLKFPVTRFSPQAEIYNFRVNGLQFANLHIDRVRLDFSARGRDTQVYVAHLDIPLETEPAGHPVLFPVHGPFVVRTGHDFQELSHTYEWSQQFAYDITCVGPHFDLTTVEGLPHRNEDFAAFGKCDILAPDEGVVIYARNDVSDDSVKAQHLRMAEPLWTIAGNIVLIRHPNGTCSLLAHMHQGSVRVRAGEHVTKGQIIGRLGASGAPGFPHVHFQLQTSESLFDGDGLPVTFENIRRLNGDHVPVPDLGGYYIAE
jgi:murein DD-endopeptidase MepM/ murein hydrolase activator NlpD